MKLDEDFVDVFFIQSIHEQCFSLITDLSSTDALVKRPANLLKGNSDWNWNRKKKMPKGNS